MTWEPVDTIALVGGVAALVTLIVSLLWASAQASKAEREDGRLR